MSKEIKTSNKLHFSIVKGLDDENDCRSANMQKDLSQQLETLGLSAFRDWKSESKHLNDNDKSKMKINQICCFKYIVALGELWWFQYKKYLIFLKFCNILS